MANVLVGLSALSLAFWVLLWLDRARAWPGRWTLPLPSPPASDLEIRAVVPARNEARRLARTLPTLLAQETLASVTVVDDRSADETAEVARGCASADRLRVERVETLPAGWGGKVFALETGVRALEERWRAAPDQRWLLFTDADIEHPSRSVEQLIERARSGPYDLVSVMARLRTDTAWGRLLLPAFVWFFHLLYPFRRVSRPKGRPAAAGGCILVRAEALEAAGGLAAIQDAVIDDIALARAVKRAGGRCWLGLEPEIHSIRPYRTLGSIVRMVSRTAFAELGYRYAFVPVVWIGLLLLFVLPPVVAVAGISTGNGLAAAFGVLAWLLQTAHVAPAMRYHGVGAAYALGMPVAAVLYGWMTTLSAWRRLRGHEARWRTPTPTR